MARTILISGASGLIGSVLAVHLRSRGDRVISLVRREPRSHDEIRWEPDAGQLRVGAVDGCHTVVNLSGAGVGDKRWSTSRKEVILQSRLNSTRVLAEAIASSPNPPSAFLSASAIGIYGQNRGDDLLDETSNTGDDFLADLSVQWEAATAPAEVAGCRVVAVRTGLVLTRGGGLLGPLVPLFKMGLGGKIGSGKQWMSWISIDDEVAAITHLIDSSVSGPVNLVAPHPVTNGAFTKALAKQLHRRAILTIPRFALKIRFGSEMAEGFALANQRVEPSRLLSDGFVYAHTDLTSALADVLGNR